MKLNILKNSGSIKIPKNNGDAGYDLIASSDPRVVGSIYQGLYYTSISHIEYDTEIKIQPELINENYEFFMLMFPRSSINKTNLHLANSVGVIDSGYTGTIKVCFKYSMQPEDMKIVEGKTFRGNNSKGIVCSINPQRIYQKGDKISQLIPCKHEDLLINYVDELNQSSRSSNGFGSTGK
jgi:dUTPase